MGTATLSGRLAVLSYGLSARLASSSSITMKSMQPVGSRTAGSILLSLKGSCDIIAAVMVILNWLPVVGDTPAVTVKLSAKNAERQDFRTRQGAEARSRTIDELSDGEEE